MNPNQAAPNPSQFDALVERLRGANNVLVTVSKNPSVDQLAACIGITVALNELGKHASAVFSGNIPSTIEFLKPEETIEKNTDSLRDFIISLDKSKADKLRYKVEDQVVRIFITPYKTSISEKDLDFGQGDFNVDAVLALGVHDRTDLDQAILAHGRILHDAVVMSVNTQGGSRLGSIDWTEPNASSLCEMASDVAARLQPEIFDPQIATALLTGIVAETDRFSNKKASPHTMSVAGALMAGGASAQLVTSKLEAAKQPPPPAPAPKKPAKKEATEPAPKPDDGLIEIEHELEENTVKLLREEQKIKDESQNVADPNRLDVPGAVFVEPESYDQPQSDVPANKIIKDPPSMGGQLTANSVPEHELYPEENADPLSKDDEPKGKTLHREKKTQKFEDKSNETLEELEKSVDSPHVQQVPPPPPVNEARDAVQEANPPEYDKPRETAGSEPVDLDLGHGQKPIEEPSEDKKPDESGDKPAGPPPPVPPPMMPPAK